MKHQLHDTEILNKIKPNIKHQLHDTARKFLKKNLKNTKLNFILHKQD